LKKIKKSKQLQEIAYAYKLPVEQGKDYMVNMEKIEYIKPGTSQEE